MQRPFVVPEMLGQLAKTLRPATASFVILTVAIFLSPVVLLGLPDVIESPIPLGFAVVSAGLLSLQLSVLAVTPLILALRKGSPPGRLSPILAGTAAILGVTNAARLALGVRWTGLGLEVAQALWFAAPLALWAGALWPLLRRNTLWWVRPLQWTAFTLPVMFLLAALGRIDFRPYTGVQTPIPVAWLFAYVPTLAGVGLALLGWLAFEERRERSRRSLAGSVAAVFLPALLVAILVSANTIASLVLSATITWGSGYQLFRTLPPLAPHTVSSFLVSAAFAAGAVTAVRLRLEGRPAAGPLLAVTVVLSGIFPSALSILGSLAAMELLWLNVSRAGDRPRAAFRVPLSSAASGAAAQRGRAPP